MNELEERLERLGLSQYLQRLVVEGFDSWDTVLDITESDLTALGVKLGHRRKLQRCIAEARGHGTERALSFDHGHAPVVETGHQSDDSTVTTKEPSGQTNLASTPAEATTAGTKRKYRRHPKADKHAPERPPSAYVIFSNQTRGEIKAQDLSFAEIAKLVGERWQVLDPALRESYEKKAAVAKDKYYAQMAEYKKTALYQEYQQYLADFKARYATPRSEGKRSRTQQEPPVEAQSRSASQEVRFGSGSTNQPSLSGHYAMHSPNASTSSVGRIAPSAPTSPAQYLTGQHSSLAERASFRPSPPLATSSHGGGYELPHHVKTNESPPEMREANRSPSLSRTQRWLTSSCEEIGPTSWTSDHSHRRSNHPPVTLPPLVHQDTSQSSHSDGFPPPIPDHSAYLPPLNYTKIELPASQHSSMAPFSLPSPSEITGLPPRASSAHLPGKQRPPSQFQALLLATELARETDLYGDDHR